MEIPQLLLLNRVPRIAAYFLRRKTPPAGLRRSFHANRGNSAKQEIRGIPLTTIAASPGDFGGFRRPIEIDLKAGLCPGRASDVTQPSPQATNQGHFGPAAECLSSAVAPSIPQSRRNWTWEGEKTQQS
jgi:hypothetical protein